MRDQMRQIPACGEAWSAADDIPHGAAPTGPSSQALLAGRMLRVRGARGKVVEQEHPEDTGGPLFRFLDALIATAPYGTDNG